MKTSNVNVNTLAAISGYDKDKMRETLKNSVYLGYGSFQLADTVEVDDVYGNLFSKGFSHYINPCGRIYSTTESGCFQNWHGDERLAACPPGWEGVDISGSYLHVAGALTGQRVLDGAWDELVTECGKHLPKLNTQAREILKKMALMTIQGNKPASLKFLDADLELPMVISGAAELLAPARKAVKQYMATHYPFAKEKVTIGQTPDGMPIGNFIEQIRFSYKTSPRWRITVPSHSAEVQKVHVLMAMEGWALRYIVRNLPCKALTCHDEVYLPAKYKHLVKELYSDALNILCEKYGNDNGYPKHGLSSRNFEKTKEGESK